MRKPFRAGGVAVGALAVALSAGAFAFAPTSAAVTSANVPASIRPGTPMKAAGGGSAAAASAITATNSVTSVQAVNWAGYAASFRTTTFRFVSARFTVPTVNCTGVTAASGALSAHWVGLDGFRNTSTTVEQVGVIAGCVDSTTPVYAAFWEMFPNGANFPTRINVNPGDKISLSVFYNRSTRKFTLTFSDANTGQRFTRTRACPAGATCRRNSAEAISEAPSLGSAILPLANFNRASFTNVAITNTSGSHRGGLRSAFWNTFKVIQVSDGTNTTVAGATIPAGTVLDNPTFLALKRNFTNRWQAANG